MDKPGPWAPFTSPSQHDQLKICAFRMKCQITHLKGNRIIHVLQLEKSSYNSGNQIGLKTEPGAIGLCPQTGPHSLGRLLAAETGRLTPMAWPASVSAPSHFVTDLIACSVTCWDLQDHPFLPLLSWALLSFLPGLLEPIATYALAYFFKSQMSTNTWKPWVLKTPGFGWK